MRDNVTTVGWQGRLDRASHVAEIVSIAKEFLATFTAGEIESLPTACRPPLDLIDIENVTSYAFDLASHKCDEFASSAELIHELAAFFSHASIRLSQLLTYKNHKIANQLSL